MSPIDSRSFYVLLARRITALLVFVGLMVYAFFTIATITASKPIIFPGIYHPIEFLVVMVVSFSALLVGYLTCTLLILRGGPTRLALARYSGISVLASGAWAVLGYGTEFVVSEGYAGSWAGVRALELTFNLPYQIIQTFGGNHNWNAWEILTDNFLGSLVALLVLGGSFLLLKDITRAGQRLVVLYIVVYVMFLGGGLGFEGSVASATGWVIAGLVVGIGLTACGELAVSRFVGAISNARKAVSRYFVVGGVCGAASALVGWLLCQIVFHWWVPTNYVGAEAILVLACAAITSLLTLVIVLRLGGSEERPSLAITQTQGLPTRPVRVSYPKI